MATPVAPTDVTFSNIKDNAVTCTSYHGGSGILERRFWWSPSISTMDAKIVGAPNTQPFVKEITGLNAGTRYYFWAQVRNADGWGTLSNPTNVVTYTQPPAPDLPVLSSITSSAVTASSASNGSGGAPVLEREFGYGTSSVSPTSTIDSPIQATSVKTITGLARSTTYYVWHRLRTNVGWSPWSPRATFKTLATVPDKPATPIPGAITQTTMVLNTTNPNDGGSAIVERQISYAKNSTDTTPTVSAPQAAHTLTGLTPATTYYIRFRVRNSIGWSAWSDAIALKTTASVYVKVGVEWKESIVWIKQNGVWKQVIPWVKILGSWRDTQ